MMGVSLLSGTWSDITAFNYAVDPRALRPFVPGGTELDFFEDQTYLSVVALTFEQPRFLGALPALLHSRFPLVTFRFYVRRRRRDGSYRRGTVFLKQYTPLTAVAAAGHLLGKSDMTTMPVTSSIFRNSSYLFWWGSLVDNCFLDARVEGKPTVTKENSFEDFVFEKKWDFVPLTTSTTLQYKARHPRWKVWTAAESEARIDMSGIFSGDLARRLSKPADSVLVAEGSRVSVGFPTPLIQYTRAKKMMGRSKRAPALKAGWI